MRKCIIVNSNDFKTKIEKAKTQKKTLVVQVAPAVRAAIGEPFGCVVKPKQIPTSLKKLGFDFVFDTTFAADVAIMEEGTELIRRYKQGNLPLMTSCCPGWVQLVESAFPQFKKHVSTTKPPQQIMGALIKNYFCQKINTNPKDIFSVSVMPCVRKQSEADKKHMNTHDDCKDVDLVLTTSDLAELLKDSNIDLCSLEESEFDAPMGDGTGGAILFGRSGGVMLAALRFAYERLTNEKLGNVNFTSNATIPSVKEAHIKFEDTGIALDIAIVAGLADAKKYINALKDGKLKHDFVEVMACMPYGCVGGGGQPKIEKSKMKETLEERKNLLNGLDNESDHKTCHENSQVNELYDEYLGQPYEGLAKDLLHTHYEI